MLISCVSFAEWVCVYGCIKCDKLNATVVSCLIVWLWYGVGVCVRGRARECSEVITQQQQHYQKRQFIHSPLRASKRMRNFTVVWWWWCVYVSACCSMLADASGCVCVCCVKCIQCLTLLWCFSFYYHSLAFQVCGIIIVILFCHITI